MKLIPFRPQVILTILTAAYILTTASAALTQSTDRYSYSAEPNQPAKTNIRIDVINPTGSPVWLTATGTNDNPYFEDVQMINFTVQNLSQKRIIAFVPLLSSISFVNGSTTESRYDLEPGRTISTALQEERTKLKSDERLTLSMDYVLFSDGTWWGPDSQKRSEYMAGYYEGERSALDQVTVLLRNNNKKELFDLLRLEQDGKIDEDSSHVDKEKTEKWRRGYLSGFRVALVGLLPMDRQRGKYIPITDDMKLDDFLLRLKNVELTRSKYLDSPK